MRHLSPLFLLFSGWVLAAACGGRAQTSDGDGDGDPLDGSGGLSGDGDLLGDGDGAGGTRGDGDASGVGGSSHLLCAPGDVTLCEVPTDPLCTGIRICAATGAAWGECLCPTGGETGGEGTGGSQNAGGAGGAGPGEDPEEPACADVVACGGDVIGAWEVSSSCLTVTGKVDLSSLGIGCDEGDIWGDLQVSGGMEFFPGSSIETGFVIDETTTSGDLALGLSRACLDVSGTTVTCEQLDTPLANTGFSSVRCLDAPSGGCLCGARVNQAGGLAYVIPRVSPGGYRVMDETLTILNTLITDLLTYSYCASEESLVVTPTDASLLFTTHGTVAFASRPSLLGREVNPNGEGRP